MADTRRAGLFDSSTAPKGRYTVNVRMDSLGKTLGGVMPSAAGASRMAVPEIAVLKAGKVTIRQGAADIALARQLGRQHVPASMSMASARAAHQSGM